MIIQELHLQNFRSFIKTEFEFSPSITFIAGPNASGKTTILEAISFLSTASGFRTSKDPEMISFESEVARVMGTIQNNPINTNNPIIQLEEIEDKKLEIVLTRGEVMGVKTVQKKYLVNGVPKRSSDFVGNLLTVLFSPADIELVTDSPSLRRHYLDSVLSQADREYHRNLSSYERGVRQRNKVLEAICDQGSDHKQLVFWDQLIIKAGNYITEKREEYIDYVNKQQITDNKEQEKMPSYLLYYDRSVISEERLFAYKNAEIASATTLVGPHRDDMVFQITGDRVQGTVHDLKLYGSRGEQRLGILWLKLAELSYLEEKREEKPVLLLDDIFSELDRPHQEMVLSIIKNQQTVITTTDMEWLQNWIHLNHSFKSNLIKLG
ncbi:hypothetical protein A3D77_00705 [Candidatus Gottesmanbacteria bacterium RIFCSPHIGHO2_02_FULL_39_11]|uniref:DNA replication and repair protein RecF n=1 Tax=Candidatus Gottesmanbacteria bacterium RIFCSPHIGHO2_02_FULL_39_11 TaxID=1798382 RepID=A0A1F5ZL62_9BACT|nr:MAG: hypothetical protein A3D77_00705 [Candidatus Gottesmanbacteria bacterium RIFCSPHIGHO2_02_FULL_39_11]